MRQTARPEFEIILDDGARLLIVSLSGFWTTGTVAAFLAAVVPAAFTARRPFGSFGVLSDLSNFAVQSGVVVKAFAHFMGTTRPMNGGRIATVYPDALGRMQIRRETPYPKMRYFSDRSSALSWLTEGEDAEEMVDAPARPIDSSPDTFSR